MIAPVTAQLLEDLFSAQHISRTPLDRQSAILTHSASRTFLADIGVPKSEGILIDIRDDLTEGLTPLLSHGPTADIPQYHGAPTDLSHWIHLGTAIHSDIALDGKTGMVYNVSELRVVTPLHTDLSSMVYGMWLLQKRRPDYDPEDAIHMLPVEESIRISEEIEAELSRLDPIPFATPGPWEGAITDIASGMW
ncbi:SUKH-4 family immunity protein [Streptomyces poonensis]|uniref:Uncharacterized protein n=1 Tax=Streptomyces poonensis TaxID=68255 RepID=A0A918QBZ7_9ACTN|nr:SUKH-4 family immunity protein [Streptomyces poonensis]GGZ39319.1 hypothetical protein GCM10010365_70110 [Streptomyces poonensis]GLJ93097.1 hypothetical protein GCM10017589_57090 [Streptomyces poonensis]